jgi:hypothetical protein
MPGTKTFLGILCSSGFGNIASNGTCNGRRSHNAGRCEFSVSRIQTLKLQRRPCFQQSACSKSVQPEPAKFAVRRRPRPQILPVHQREPARSWQKMLRKPSKSFECIFVSLLSPSTTCIGISSNRALASQAKSRANAERLRSLNALGTSGSPTTSNDIGIRPFLHVVTPA